MKKYRTKITLFAEHDTDHELMEFINKMAEKLPPGQHLDIETEEV